jgi:Secretion system C-terminal sorting domain/Pregnancy-associated plasma protein-A
MKSLKSPSGVRVLILILLLGALLINSVLAQSKVGQIWKCSTEENLTSNTIKFFDDLSTTVTTDTIPKIINIFIHIIRRSDGTGGLTDAQVNNWILRLCNDYSIHKILVRETGRAGLNNTTFFNGITDNNYSTLINTDTHSNSIDIYLLSPTDTYSRASGIPGIALAVGGSYQGTSVLSHEFGHCLGLYHTHSGRGCGDNANCAENINESNCSTCGDLVCDTPADPCLSGNVDAVCNYIGDPSFTPDVHNIMSYAPPNCLTHITAGQTWRIHTSILNNTTIFNARSYRPNISGPSPLCTTGSYTVNNLPAGCTVYWTNSSNISLPTNRTTNPITATANGSGSGWLQVSITTNCSASLPQFIVWVGAPQLSVTGPSQGCVNNTFYFTSSPIGQNMNAINYTWNLVPLNGNYLSPYGYQNSQCAITFYNPYSASGYWVQARAQNTCGTGNYAQTNIWIHTCLTFSLYPNPASQTVTVTKSVSGSSDKSLLSEDATTVYTVRIIDMYGSLYYTATNSGDSFDLPISSLKDGIYIVQISSGKDMWNLQLVVKH